MSRWIHWHWWYDGNANRVDQLGFWALLRYGLSASWYRGSYAWGIRPGSSLRRRFSLDLGKLSLILGPVSLRWPSDHDHDCIRAGCSQVWDFKHRTMLH